MPRAPRTLPARPMPAASMTAPFRTMTPVLTVGQALAPRPMRPGWRKSTLTHEFCRPPPSPGGEFHLPRAPCPSRVGPGRHTRVPPAAAPSAPEWFAPAVDIPVRENRAAADRRAAACPSRDRSEPGPGGCKTRYRADPRRTARERANCVRSGAAARYSRAGFLPACCPLPAGSTARSHRSDAATPRSPCFPRAAAAPYRPPCAPAAAACRRMDRPPATRPDR